MAREFDRRSYGCRTLHSRTTEPQRNLIPPHGILCSSAHAFHKAERNSIEVATGTRADAVVSMDGLGALYHNVLVSLFVQTHSY